MTSPGMAMLDPLDSKFGRGTVSGVGRKMKMHASTTAGFYIVQMRRDHCVCLDPYKRTSLHLLSWQIFGCNLGHSRILPA